VVNLDAVVVAESPRSPRTSRRCGRRSRPPRGSRRAGLLKAKHPERLGALGAGRGPRPRPWRSSCDGGVEAAGAGLPGEGRAMRSRERSGEGRTAGSAGEGPRGWNAVLEALEAGARLWTGSSWRGPGGPRPGGSSPWPRARVPSCRGEGGAWRSSPGAPPTRGGGARLSRSVPEPRRGPGRGGRAAPPRPRDGVEDPRNLGAILRTAAAAGAHAVVLPQHGGSGITGVVARAAAGALERVPLVRQTNLARPSRSWGNGGSGSRVWTPGGRPPGTGWTGRSLPPWWSGRREGGPPARLAALRPPGPAPPCGGSEVPERRGPPSGPSSTRPGASATAGEGRGEGPRAGRRPRPSRDRGVGSQDQAPCTMGARWL